MQLVQIIIHVTIFVFPHHNLGGSSLDLLQLDLQFLSNTIIKGMTILPLFGKRK